MRQAEILAALRGPGTRPQVLECLQALAAPLHTDDPECECIEVVEPADFYQDGMDACADGTYERDCPHADGSARVQWLRGYRDFMPIRGEWEAENHDRARMYA